MKIAFLDTKTVGDLPNLGNFEDFGEFITYSSTPLDQVPARITDVDVLITNKVSISREAMFQASQLKLICIAATGMNNVDLAAAHEKGIVVKNVVDYSTHSVAQHSFSLVLSLLNNPALHDQYVRSGTYSRDDIFTYLGAPFWQLKDKRFGIIGLGNIGKKVAEIAEAFGCEIVYYSSSGKNRHDRYLRLELEELLKTSHVVSVHAPLNAKTENLITYEKIRLMNSDAVLVNTSRGGIIHEGDLAKACDEKLIRGAGVDVFSQEPLPADHPYLNVQKPERLLLTPHIAWTSEESRLLLVDRIYENIRTFLKD
jgi:lactate dehydrogenase-like 2-hydroxyacid dehydrogenase